jgi:hypothetical protein
MMRTMEEANTDLFAKTERYREEALRMLDAINVGAQLRLGLSRQEAGEMLSENIATYEHLLRLYGWSDNASRS